MRQDARRRSGCRYSAEQVQKLSRVGAIVCLLRGPSTGCLCNALLCFGLLAAAGPAASDLDLLLRQLPTRLHLH